MAMQIAGVGCTSFGDARATSLTELGARAVRAALDDAGAQPDEIDGAFVANSFAGLITEQASVVGQAVVQACGMSRIPVFNVDNACAGSGCLLSLASMAIESGAMRRVLVVGVEKMIAEDERLTYRAVNSATTADLVPDDVDRDVESVFTKHLYPAMVAGYADAFGLTADTLARIVVKNRRHAALNDVARYREPLTVADVLAARPVGEILTTLMCAPVADGASAAVVTVRDGAAARDDRAVPVVATHASMGGARPGARSSIEEVVARVLAAGGVGPADVDVAEVNDSTAFGELRAYELLGFAPPGGGSALVQRGVTELGGALPVNVSGGLGSRGHAVAATGLAQIHELVTQLRGEAGARQVDGARVALAHNMGGFVGGDAASIAVTLLGEVAP